MSRPDALHRETPRLTELRLAEELEQLDGVLAAAVRLGEGTDVRDVYIAAAEGVDLAALRGATTQILRRAGLTLSPTAMRVGSVSAAQPQSAPPGEPAPAAPWQGRFLLLEGVDVQRSGNHVQCRVRLLRLEQRFEGQAEELDTELGRARAAARATLAAAEQASPSALGLEGAQIAELFGRRYVVISVEANAARRFVVLSGILALDNTRSLEEASCLAALRAIERFISW